jgi:hypothetical protein
MQVNNQRYAIYTPPPMRYKRPDIVIRDDGSGRWGTKWLRKLVLRAAKNLGMLKHLIEEIQPEDVLTFTPMDVSLEVRERVWQAANSYLDMGPYTERDLVVYMGPDCFREGLKEMRNCPGAYFDMVLEGGQRGRYRIIGINCVMSPLMTGMVVVPKLR